jgi:hypothetical protein
MNPAIESFAEFFSSQGWSYNQASNKPVIHAGFTGDNGRWSCLAAAGPQDEYLLFLSLFPYKAPPSRRVACVELLGRINFALTHGCFEMDFDDGEIRFRTSIPLLSAEISPELVEHIVFSNLCTFDRFFGAIMKVIYADIAPKSALNRAKTWKPSASRFELN